MKKLGIINYRRISIVCLIFLISASQASSQLGDEAPYISPPMNPAAEYCIGLGYEYVVVETPEGQGGECKISEDVSFRDADFLQGKAGGEYGICGKKGLETKSMTGTDVCGTRFKSTCGVCVLEDGSTKEVLTLLRADDGVTDSTVKPTSTTSTTLTTPGGGSCGNDLCESGETEETCPQDCGGRGFNWFFLAVIVVGVVVLIFIWNKE